MKKRKAIRRLNKMRRAGVKAWKKKKNCKWQLSVILFLVPLVCMSSFKGQDSWREICISKGEFIKKEWILRNVHRPFYRIMILTETAISVA